MIRRRFHLHLDHIRCDDKVMDMGWQRCVERRDHAVGDNMSPTIFVRELGCWHHQMLIRPPVKQILAPMQADEVTKQAMLLPEEGAVILISKPCSSAGTSEVGSGKPNRWNVWATLARMAASCSISMRCQNP